MKRQVRIQHSRLLFDSCLECWEVEELRDEAPHRHRRNTWKEQAKLPGGRTLRTVEEQVVIAQR
jgi:hypothetical protein